jgi:two pore calcium channel protein 3
MVIFVFYSYTVVGMQWFGGLICEPNTDNPGMLFDLTSNYSREVHTCNPKLEGSGFATDGYYLNNFNDPVSSFVTLFELMIVNQWHILVEGFVTLTSRWARLYFLSFNVLMVVIVLNVFLSFVIEAYVLQIGLEHLKFEDVLITKLDLEIERSPALKDEYERTAIRKTRSMQAVLAHLFGGDDDDDTPQSAATVASPQAATADLSSA